MEKVISFKKAFVCTSFLIALTATSAIAAENTTMDSGLYVSGNIGIGILSDSSNSYTADPGYVLTGSSSSNSEFDKGLVAGAAVGYGFGNNLRIEGEVEYQHNDMDKSTSGGVTIDASPAETSMWSFLGNAYYDFTNNSPLTPYIGVGLGFAKVTAENSSVGFDVDDTIPIVQFGAGVGYMVSNNVTVDFKYRYLSALSDPEFAFNHVTIDSEVNSHNLMFGLRIGL